LKVRAEPPPVRPLARAVALVVIVLAGAVALGILIWGAIPRAHVSGSITGDSGSVKRVMLSDPQRGVLRPGSLDGNGRYLCGVPRAALSPQVVFHGEGGALVRSRVLQVKDDETLELEPLGLWSADTRVREREGVIRFDWGPIPKGDGYPKTLRYSLLVTYPKLDGTPGETSLQSRVPSMTIPRQELLDLLKDWNLKEGSVSLSLRAFDPTSTEGALWVAGTRDWLLKASPQKAD
jgi:hypothetical protein